MKSFISETVRKMIEYFDGDVHQVNHALKVYSFAKSIGELENIPEDKLEILEISAILHDVGIKESMKKYSSSAARYQELEGPPIARELLKDFNLSEDFLERVSYLIGNHHTYSKIDDVDFQILAEADFLVNIFENNMKKEEIDSIRQKYFRTAAGTLFLDLMYNRQPRDNQGTLSQFV